MNLLYRGFKIGACNLVTSSAIECFTYDLNRYVNCASYFATLQPNTTYTIKKHDTSSRFRVATYNTDYSAVDFEQTGNFSVPVQQWVTPANDVLTFTTGDEDIYLVVQYTNNYEYICRIMLNAGSAPTDYEEPTVALPNSDLWLMQDEGLFIQPAQALGLKNIIRPYPSAYWRIDNDVFNNQPYHANLPWVEVDEPFEVYSIKPQEQIQVYEYTTAQNDLLNRNGNAILFPESCISRHELNGRWDITLTHKIDKLKKWEYLKYENILKVGGQLFRIDTQQTQVDYDKELITAHANHIFYDLNQRIVQRDSSGNERAVFVSDSSSIAAQTFWALLSERPYPLNAIEYWQNTLSSDSKYIPVIWDLEDATPYVFEKHYDSAYWNTEQPSMDYHGKTVVDLLIGSDGFINRWGGEIYRNNFYFSIKPTIEDCQDNSFYLRFPVELKSQVHSIDINKLASIISFIDVNGNYAHGDVQSNIYGLHHHRPVVVQLNVPYSTEVGEIIWNDYKKLPVSTEVELNELKYNARFKDKRIAVSRYHVGDKGYIMIQGKKEHYRIIAVERDEITKDFISITFKKID